jgi:hypothetical protein
MNKPSQRAPRDAPVEPVEAPRASPLYTTQDPEAPLPQRLLEALRLAREPVYPTQLAEVTWANLREVSRALRELQARALVICTPEDSYALYSSPQGHRARVLEVLVRADRPLVTATVAERADLPLETCAALLARLARDAEVERYDPHTPAWWSRYGKVRVQRRPYRRLIVEVIDWRGRPCAPAAVIEHRAHDYRVLEPSISGPRRANHLEEAVFLAHGGPLEK